MNRRAFFRRTVGGVVAATVAPLLPPAPTAVSTMASVFRLGESRLNSGHVLGGWGQPTTWVVGDLVTSSLMNEHIRDNLLYLRCDDSLPNRFTVR